MWVGNQLPPLIHEKILLGRVTLTIQFLFGLLLLLLIYPTLKVAIRAYMQAGEASFSKKGRYEFICFMTSFASVGMAIGGIALTTDSVNQLIMVWLAPHIYILEWLRSLL